MNKRKHIKLLISILIASLFLTACRLGSISNVTGSGVMAEESREVSDVSSIKYSTYGKLIITVGDTESLTIEGEDNMFAYLLTDVANGKLTIQSRPNLDIEPTKSLTFFLTVERLDGIEITSSGVVEVTGLETDSFEVKVSGSGALSISDGNVKSQKVTISGDGTYDAENLESDEAEVKVSGDSTATVWVNNQLTVDISGNAEVRYRGDPAIDGKSSDAEGLNSISD